MASVLDELRRMYPTAKMTTLRHYAEAGRVFVGSAMEKRLKSLVPPGVAVTVRGLDDLAAAAAEAERDAHKLEIIHDDDDVVIVNKPAGLLTSTNTREKRPTVLAILRRTYEGKRNVRIGVIHRLDRDARGLLVFSKRAEAFEHLKRELFHRRMKREYLAVVEGKISPASGTLSSWLVEYIDGTVHECRAGSPRGEQAVTHYETVESADSPRPVSLLRVQLETGRKHQIRVHMQIAGFPIVGDEVYGKPDRGGLRLLAYRLGFSSMHDGRWVEFELPRPDDFWQRVGPPSVG
jgi:23S rRNA pseudouridine1911/1915/1917 synthase